MICRGIDDDINNTNDNLAMVLKMIIAKDISQRTTKKKHFKGNISTITCQKMSGRSLYILLSCAHYRKYFQQCSNTEKFGILFKVKAGFIWPPVAITSNRVRE